MYITLDLQYFAGEKTEKASPKKREDERQKGKVAKSQDLNTAFLLFFSFILLAVAGTFMKDQMLALFTSAFTEYIFLDVNIQSVMELVRIVLIQFILIVAPIMVVVVIVAVAVNMVQAGVLFTTEPLKLDLKKIDPISGAKRIFALRAIVELLKSLFKIAIIGTITFSVIWIYKDDMMELASKPPETAVAFFGRLTIIMGVAATIALLFLGIIDYLYQKYDFEKNIRMSKQDVKDEHKNMEGDPFIKGKLKEKQRQVAMGRMMQEVPKADVIITNPTHYAIAVKYDEQISTAPYVLAKGTDKTALRIREKAKEHDIMTVENKSLARAMYDSVEINQSIPEEFYEAIAEVLAFVYQTERRINS